MKHPKTLPFLCRKLKRLPEPKIWKSDESYVEVPRPPGAPTLTFVFAAGSDGSCSWKVLQGGQRSFTTDTSHMVPKPTRTKMLYLQLARTLTCSVNRLTRRPQAHQEALGPVGAELLH